MALDLVGALLGWLVADVGGAGVRRAGQLARGDPVERSLRSVVISAAVDLSRQAPGLDQHQQEHLAAVLVASTGSLGGRKVRSEADLREVLAEWTMELDRPEFDGSGYLSGLGLDADEVAAGLADAILSAIEADARDGGPLGTLAGWLWRDGTRRQLDRIERAVTEDRPSASVAPVSSWTAFDLDVHRALPVAPMPEDATPSDLPPYFRRRHDDLLDAELRDVAASKMVVLTGDSATGKTRALYEAVTRRRDFNDLQLVYPRLPEELLAAVDIVSEARGPCVLWLDDLHGLLRGQAGERCAVALRRLLRRLQAAPVLVLGTEWTEIYDRWVESPTEQSEHRAGEEADDQPQVRQLLKNAAIRISVPDTFDPSDRRKLQQETSDRRLLTAASGADGRVIQRMTGGPQLVAWYEHARVEVSGRLDARLAVALVTAAIDLRRISYTRPSTARLLIDAADGYLTSIDRHDVTPASWQQALARTGNLVDGAAALSRTPLSPSTGRVDGYNLHDYLEQHGTLTRSEQPAEASVWDSVVAHSAGAGEAARMADEAESRLLYRHAEMLYERAIAAGSADSRRALYRLWIRQGRDTEVRDRAVDGDTEAAAVLVRWLIDTGRTDEAIAARRTVMTARFDEVGIELGDLLLKSGDTDRAIEEYETALRAGHEHARRALARALLSAGRLDKAIEAVAPKGTTVPWWFIHQVFQAGNPGRACALVEAALEARTEPDALDAPQIVDHLEQAHRRDLVARLAATGHRPAIQFLDSERVENCDETELAALVDSGTAGAREERARRLLDAQDETVLRRLADQGDWHAQRQLAELLAARGELGEAIRLLGDLASSEDRDGPPFGAAEDVGPRLVELIVQTGDETALAALVEDCVPGTRRPLAAHWHRTGRLDELRRLAQSPDGFVRRRLVDLLDRADRQSELAVLARRSSAAHKHVGKRRVDNADLPELLRLVVTGDSFARRALHKLIDEPAGRIDVTVIRHHGLRPDGTVASPASD